MSFVLTNSSSGDMNTEMGKIPRGGSLTVDFLPPTIMAAIKAKAITCSVTLPDLTVLSPLASAYFSYTSGTNSIVDPTDGPTTRANDVTLAAQINELQAQIASIWAYITEGLPHRP